MSGKLEPLYKLLKNDNKIEINSPNTRMIIKDALNDITHSISLNHPDPNKEFQLEADASDIACGAILKQDDKITGIFSYIFKNSEINYTIVEKETLAILKAINHFRNIVFNSKIVIYTDSMNIIYSKGMTNRINRWKIILEEYNYEIKHISGVKNIVADQISRLYVIKHHNIYLKTKSLRKIENKLIIENNKEKIIEEIHNQLIHPGINNLYCLLKDKFFIKNLKKIIIEITNKCVICSKNKVTKHKYGKLQNVFTVKNKNETVSLDLKGPIKTKHFNTQIKEKYFYIFTASDILTRYTEIKIIFNIKSETICKALEEIWIKHNKAPENILTDQGRQFTSGNFKKMLDDYKINLKHTSAYNPTGNSITERINKQIGEGLRILRGKSLKELEIKIYNKINHNYNKTINMTPFEAYIGKSSITNTKIKNINSEELARKNILNKIYNLKRINKNRISYNYKINSMAYRKNNDQDKIIEKYSGPFKIIQIKNDKIYLDEINKITENNIKNLKPVGGENVIISSPESHGLTNRL